MYALAVAWVFSDLQVRGSLPALTLEQATFLPWASVSPPDLSGVDAVNARPHPPGPFRQTHAPPELPCVLTCRAHSCTLAWAPGAEPLNCGWPPIHPCPQLVTDEGWS